MTRTYTSPVGFKQALEERLRTSSTNGADFARRRQLLVFDRFLARVTTTLGDSVTLKGGLVLELRLERARTTKDVDLSVMGSPQDLLERLQESARLSLPDFMTFEVEPHDEHPTIQNDGMQYEGQRFRATCRLAGKIYGQPFGVDVAFGEPMFGTPDIVTAPDVLAFAGIAPPTIKLFPVETHLAEKLHAYTMPRARRLLAKHRCRGRRSMMSTPPSRSSSTRCLRKHSTRRGTRRRAHGLATRSDTL